MIKKSRRISTSRTNTRMLNRQPISASRSITSGVKNRQSNRSISAASNVQLNPEQRAFCNQLRSTCRKKQAVMGATNTSNILARPDFLELLPLFVQKLIILDVFGSVAMKSRQQLIPYFKFIAENSKGQTESGTVLSSPFANRQGVDHNLTGRVIKNEQIASDGKAFTAVGGAGVAYTPVLPGSVTITYTLDAGQIGRAVDSAYDGKLVDAKGTTFGTINYATGDIRLEAGIGDTIMGTVSATYQYDNETVGPDGSSEYGAKMAKGYLALDEFNLVAEAHQLACYWSIYSAFAAQQEYGANIGDIAKEAAFSEITAEINTKGFMALRDAAKSKPQFNWDASAVLSGSVVPSDYLNMFKLKLGQAAASIYQTTRLSRPNRLVVGSNAAEYIAMINGFASAGTQDSVGPYKLGSLDNFDIYVEPSYDPDEWVMACKSNDIRRNSALFGEYMPLTDTAPIGLANASVQQGYATMYGMKVVNPDTVVSGRILGTF